MEVGNTSRKFHLFIFFLVNKLSTQGLGTKLFPYSMVSGIFLPAMISVSTASSLIIPAHHGRLTSGQVMGVATVVSFLANSMHEIPIRQKITVN